MKTFNEGDSVQVLVARYGAWYSARYVAPASGGRHMVEVHHPYIGHYWVSDDGIKPLAEGETTTSQPERKRRALQALGDAVYLHSTVDQGYIGTITAWTNKAIALGAGSAEIATAFIDGMPLKNALPEDPERDLTDSIVDTDPEEL